MFVPVIYVAVELSWPDLSDEELRNIFGNLRSENVTGHYWWMIDAKKEELTVWTDIKIAFMVSWIQYRKDVLFRSHICLSNIRLRWTLGQFSVKSPPNALQITHLFLTAWQTVGNKTGLSFVASLCARYLVTTNHILQMRYAIQSKRLHSTARKSHINMVLIRQFRLQSFHGCLDIICKANYKQIIIKWIIFFCYCV